LVSNVAQGRPGLGATNDDLCRATTPPRADAVLLACSRDTCAISGGGVKAYRAICAFGSPAVSFGVERYE